MKLVVTAEWICNNAYEHSIGINMSILGIANYVQNAIISSSR